MAVYQAQLNQTILLASDEDHTVHAPGNASDGHWFAIKHTFQRVSTIHATTVDSLTGDTIEDFQGGGQVASAMTAEHRTYARFVKYGTAWYLERNPRPPVELFDYAGAALLLGTNTPIPLTEDPIFGPTATYFTVAAGNLECVVPFSGLIQTRVYFEWVFPGNNQDASGLVDLFAVAGTPLIQQGHGVAASYSTPRSGTFYSTVVNVATVIASVGDIIGLRGSDDPTQSGATSVLDDTGLLVSP